MKKLLNSLVVLVMVAGCNGNQEDAARAKIEAEAQAARIKLEGTKERLTTTLTHLGFPAPTELKEDSWIQTSATSDTAPNGVVGIVNLPGYDRCRVIIGTRYDKPEVWLQKVEFPVKDVPSTLGMEHPARDFPANPKPTDVTTWFKSNARLTKQCTP